MFISEEQWECDHGAWVVQLGKSFTQRRGFWDEKKARKIANAINEGRSGMHADTRAVVIDCRGETIKQQQDAKAAQRQQQEAEALRAQVEEQADDDTATS